MTKTKINYNYLTIYRLQNPNKLKHPPPSPQQPNGTKLKLFHFSTTQSKNKTNLKKTYTYISQIGNLPEIPLCKKKWTFLLCGSSA